MRIVFIKPCCIGDVVMATAALQALRRGYPDAHITWAVGGWSRQAIEGHPMIDVVLDTGSSANPAVNPLRFARQLADGQFDLAVSLVRSPLMSLAVWLSGIPQRAGLNSAGRGFGYNIRAPIDPQIARPEAEIYLDVIAALGLDTAGCYANVPVDISEVYGLISGEYVVINPTGGNNPGMMMDSKRWPPQNFAALADALNFPVVLVGGPGDAAIIEAVKSHMMHPAVTFIGTLSFQQIGALAKQARAYIGNDTGLTHLAAAAGAKTVMIFGPSDPVRYAPYTPDSLALWKPTDLHQGGVVAGTPADWDWSRDGISTDDVIAQVQVFMQQ